MTEQASLETLMRQGLVWRGGETKRHAVTTPLLPTGFDVLDRALGGGWPADALVELLSEQGEGLVLLLPLMARLGCRAHWIALVEPPWRLHLPALRARGVDPARLLLVRAGTAAQALWAVEQLLRGGGCSLVLAWPRKAAPAALRRLQLAAGSGRCSAVLFRPLQAANSPSPAALRLRLQPQVQGLALEVLKRPGGWGGCRLQLPWTQLE